jgi:hypothetical protein
MHKSTIDETLEAIKTATKEALKSREASLKFLFDATIIGEKEYKKLLKQKPVLKTA